MTGILLLFHICISHMHSMAIRSRNRKGKLPFTTAILETVTVIYTNFFQGFAPHISPFTSVQDLGNLLNRAGFTMLTIVSTHNSILQTFISQDPTLADMLDKICPYAKQFSHDRANRCTHIHTQMGPFL